MTKLAKPKSVSGGRGDGDRGREGGGRNQKEHKGSQISPVSSPLSHRHAARSACYAVRVKRHENHGLRKSVFGGGRVAFIDEGRIIDQGPPRHVFHESPEPRVRQFLQTYHDRNAF